MAADTYVNISSELDEIRNRGADIAVWEPVSWEVTAHLVAFALVPAVYWAVGRFPPVDSRWLRNLAIHAGFALLFSVIHVTGMVGLRLLVYRAMGRVYEFGDWWAGFAYELRKDLLTYGLIVLAIYALRSLIGPTQAKDRTAGARRLSLSTDRGRVMLRPGDIRWLEAAGNYVVVHSVTGRFEIRSSLTGFLDSLDSDRFLRIHRRHAVRLGAIRSVRPAAHGDAVATLDDGTELRISRRFRKGVNDSLAGSHSASRAKATT